MSNMSYCQFENTLSDMKQILDTMREARSVEDLDMGSHERSAFNEIGQIADEISEAWYDLMETVE